MVLFLRALAWLLLYGFYALAFLSIFTLSNPDARNLAVVSNVVVGIVLWVLMWFGGNVVQGWRSR